MTTRKNTNNGRRFAWRRIALSVIREIMSGQQAFFQSRAQLNTPGLGTLMPENFRQVAELSDQCKELFRLELIQAMEAHNKFLERDYQFNWMSVYMPLKFLWNTELDRTLMKFCENTKYRKIVFVLRFPTESS